MVQIENSLNPFVGNCLVICRVLCLVMGATGLFDVMAFVHPFPLSPFLNVYLRVSLP